MGWVLVPPGDAALTRRVRAAGESWSVARGPSSGVDALAPALAVGAAGISAWDGARWVDEGAPPAAITAVTAAITEADGTRWVGGRDALGAPRIFKRTR